MSESVWLKLKRARRVSVPLVALTTADQCASERSIAVELNGSSPVVAWDIVRGFRGLNELGVAAIEGALGGNDPSSINNPVEALVEFGKFPGCVRDGSRITQGGTVLVMHGAHLWLEGSVAARQALLNLRDTLKADNRMVVLLAPQLVLPIELQQSVELFDESLPSDDEVRGIVSSLVSDAGLTAEQSVIDEAVGSLRGLSAFSIDQCAAMSLSRSGLNVSQCWERKEAAVSQTRGLSMFRPSLKFSDLGGLDTFKRFMLSVANGPKRPRLIVWVDELEKALAGSGADGGAGDNTGVTQDQIGTLLREMESSQWVGAILLGPPGSGKTALCLATGGECGIPVVSLDLGGMKSSGVGDSEAAIRQSVKVIKSCGGADVLFLATCNKLSSLPPEIRRRFRLGLWFVDLPSDAEKRVIWSINLKSRGLDESQALPVDAGWSGANIRDVCDIALSTGLSVVEAAKFIVSATEQDSRGIEELRRMASGRYLSASYPGAYRLSGVQSAPAVSGRAIQGGE